MARTPRHSSAPSSTPAEADGAPPTGGIIPSQRIRGLVRDGFIASPTPIHESQVQPASLDLRLGPLAYRVRASFLPNPAAPVSRRLDDLTLHTVDLSHGSVMERSCVYVVPLQETLRLPPTVWAKANPKSSTGRLDVLTRVITEDGAEFDRVPAGYAGPLYLEIVPRTFSVVVRAGCRLSQLRFVQGDPLMTDARMTELHAREPLVYDDADAPGDPLISRGLWISVDLQGSGPEAVVGYRARPHAPLVDLDRVAFYDPAEFWEPLPRGLAARVILNPGDFYILSSREKVSLPAWLAAEMVGYDPAVGEFRVHYAGFFDPGFGAADAETRGTRAVLEVRSHEVPFLLEDGQRVGRLVYERLVEPPDKVYGVGIGSSYQRQGLTLAKQFRATGSASAGPARPAASRPAG